MRPIVYSLGVLRAACSGDDANDESPTSDADTDTDTDTDADTDSDTDTDTDADTDTDTDTDALLATVAASPHVDNVFWVTVEGSDVGDTWVEYGLDGALDQQTDPVAGPGAEVPLLGLKGGRSYSWRAVVDTAGGPLVSETMTLTTATPPATLDDATLEVSEPDHTPGYLFLSTLGQEGTYVAIFDDEGDPVWWVKTAGDDVVITAIPGPDGESVGWGVYDQQHEVDIGKYVRVRVDGTELTETRLLLGHHAVYHHPDDTIAFLAYDFRDTPTDNGPVTRMASDRIFEIAEGSTDTTAPVEIYNAFDDFGALPALTCEHIASDFDRFTERNINEWTHGNSLVYLSSEDAYYYNTKFTDWMLKIDRATGEVLWQMNGLGGDFTLPGGDPVWDTVDDPALWSHSHMSQVWEGGMLTFDNGDHRTPQMSSIAEIEWNESTMTAERVWEHWHPTGDYSYAIGDARKLDNGNYLAAWGQLGTLQEVTADHRTLWELQLPPGITVGRVRHFSSLTSF